VIDVGPASRSAIKLTIEEAVQCRRLIRHYRGLDEGERSRTGSRTRYIEVQSRFHGACHDRCGPRNPGVEGLGPSQRAHNLTADGDAIGILEIDHELERADRASPLDPGLQRQALAWSYREPMETIGRHRCLLTGGGRRKVALHIAPAVRCAGK